MTVSLTASTSCQPSRRRLRRIAIAAMLAIPLLASIQARDPAEAVVNPSTGCSTAAVVAVSNSDSNLYRWTRPTPTSGSWSNAAQVGSSTTFGSLRVLASDELTGDLFGIDNSGNLHRYWYSSGAYTGGDIIGTGWSSTTQLIPAGNGVLYGIRSDGSLYWYHWMNGAWDLIKNGATRSNGTQIGSGWNNLGLVVSGGAGILYGVRKSDGALLWYRNMSPGMGVDSWQGPKVVGSGWGTMKALVGLGRGVIYAVTPSGALMQYSNTGYFTGDATWDNNGVGVQIGSNWLGYSRITANPTACSPAAAGRTDNTTSPVYFVHGLGGGTDLLTAPEGGWDCSWYFSAFKQRFAARGWTGPLRTVSFYGKDTNCEGEIYNGGDMDTPIEDLGKALAWWVYRHNTLFGQPVDLIGHSMGGLIIRDAITRSGHRSDYPPTLYVEDAVTLDTPHQGSSFSRLCAGLILFHQCDELSPGRPFLGSLGANPQSTFGTDWTTIGAGDDDRMQWQSFTGRQTDASGNFLAGAMAPGHVVVYDSGQFGAVNFATGAVHMAVLHPSLSNTYSATHYDYHGQRLDPLHGDGWSGPSAILDLSAYYWPGSAPDPIDWAYEAASHFAFW